LRVARSLKLRTRLQRADTLARAAGFFTRSSSEIQACFRHTSRIRISMASSTLRSINSDVAVGLCGGCRLARNGPASDFFLVRRRANKGNQPASWPHPNGSAFESSPRTATRRPARCDRARRRRPAPSARQAALFDVKRLLIHGGRVPIFVSHRPRNFGEPSRIAQFRELRYGQLRCDQLNSFAPWLGRSRTSTRVASPICDAKARGALVFEVEPPTRRLSSGHPRPRAGTTGLRAASSYLFETSASSRCPTVTLSRRDCP